METHAPFGRLKRLDRWRLCLIIFVIAYGAILATTLSANSMVWDEVTHLNGGLLLSRGQIGTWAFTNSFYPPIYDFFTAVYFLIFGPSVLAARLVSVTFSVLTLFVIYEIANLLYNSKKVALAAAVLFGVMPGIVWLSRLAMIETLLIFVLSLSLLFFFRWLRTNRQRDQILSIAAFVVGVAVKYQVLVILPIIVLVGTYFWKKDYFKAEVKKWFILPRILVMAAVLVAVAIAAYVLLASGKIDFLLYAFGVGSEQKATYSLRYPVPIFYLVEMAWFNDLLHPVSVLLYLVGLAGLGFMLYRRKSADKFLLLWFTVVYIVFTLVPNREWRYVTIAFPVLAIAASSLIMAAFGRLQRSIRSVQTSLNRWGIRIVAAFLLVFVFTGLIVSCVDAYTWVEEDRINAPVEQASLYAGQGLGQNQTLVVACAVNRFNKNMVSFYLSARNSGQDFNQTCLQYPGLAVDSFTPPFNITELVELCQQKNVKYVMLYEYGSLEYFESTLSAPKVYDLLNATGYFTLAATFGDASNRIFVLEFEKQN